MQDHSTIPVTINDDLIKKLNCKTRRVFSTEQKMRMLLEGIDDPSSIPIVCKAENLTLKQYNNWLYRFETIGQQKYTKKKTRDARVVKFQKLRTKIYCLENKITNLQILNELLKLKHQRAWGEKRHTYTAEEKFEIIQIVGQSAVRATLTLKTLGILHCTYLNWIKKFNVGGLEALRHRNLGTSVRWNCVPDNICKQIIKMAIGEPNLGARLIALRFIDEHEYFISQAFVYRLMKKHGLIKVAKNIPTSASAEFKYKPNSVNELWQTDFTTFRIKGFGHYYLSTILDDFSRYIIAWKFCKKISTENAIETLELALRATNMNGDTVAASPKLLSDNGGPYQSREFAKYLSKNGITHTHGRPYHPQTQGKIERWHRTLKTDVNCSTCVNPDELKVRINDFIVRYNSEYKHMSLNNITPLDVYTEKSQLIVEKRNQTKAKTTQMRRLNTKKLRDINKNTPL